MRVVADSLAIEARVARVGPSHLPRIALSPGSGLRMSIDRPLDSAGAVIDVTIADHAGRGLFVGGCGLVAGLAVTLDVPLIGARDAVIRWITADRMGCRLSTPLSVDELRKALLASAVIAQCFPGLLRADRPVAVHAGARTPLPGAV